MVGGAWGGLHHRGLGFVEVKLSMDLTFISQISGDVCVCLLVCMRVCVLFSMQCVEAVGNVGPCLLSPQPSEC